MPAGTKLEIRGRRQSDPTPVYALGGNALTQRTVALPDGSVAAWFVFDAANTPLIGLEIRIYNDVSGGTVFTAASTVDVGEIAILQAVDVLLDRGWRRVPIDPTVRSRTIGGQLASVARRHYRRYTVELLADEVARVRDSALANSMDWEKLEAALVGDQRCAALLRWRDSAGAIDADELHRTAVYGVCSEMPGIEHLGGDYYGSNLTFDEVPPA